MEMAAADPDQSQQGCRKTKSPRLLPESVQGRRGTPFRQEHTGLRVFVSQRVCAHAAVELMIAFCALLLLRASLYPEQRIPYPIAVH